VRFVLADDPRTRSFADQAKVVDGRVILAGRTYHSEYRTVAEGNVRRLAGVQSVEDQVVVERNSDLEIAQRVHASFSADPAVDDGAIGVSVIHGKVVLSGTAESAEALAHVNEIVLSTPGVVSVSNGLQVFASPLSKRLPRIGGTYPTYPNVRR
jgi:osmotically-inducible protein OsmY